MTHSIKKSLAGTVKQYIVMKENEGFRMRQMDNELARIHVEKEAPGIDSRDRNNASVPYWAVDLNLKALKGQIKLVEGGEEEVQTDGIDHVLAGLEVKHLRLKDEQGYI